MLVLDLEQVLERPKQEQCHRQEHSPKLDRFLSQFPANQPGPRCNDER
jgi:hypothetical protein